MTKNWLAIGTLLLTNMLPLIGLFLFDWQVGELIILYWIENGVIGFYNIPKIMMAAKPPKWESNGVKLSVNGSTAWQKSGLVPFFIMHYGIFWVVHGAFAFGFFSEGFGLGYISPWFVIVVLSMIFSHGVSFVTNYIGRGEYLQADPTTRMFSVYGRVVVLHLTVIFGAFAQEAFANPAAAGVVLIVLKTIADIGTHLASHSSSYSNSSSSSSVSSESSDSLISSSSD